MLPVRLRQAATPIRSVDCRSDHLETTKPDTPMRVRNRPVSVVGQGSRPYFFIAASIRSTGIA
jgi:hypothetical protein